MNSFPVAGYEPNLALRTQGFAADPDSYWKGEVFAYVGSIQNLKDLKDLLKDLLGTSTPDIRGGM